MDQEEALKDLADDIGYASPLDEVMHLIERDYYIIPKKLMPTIDYGFIGDPQEKLSDGTDVSAYRPSRENVETLTKCGYKYLVIADRLREKLVKKETENMRAEIWAALVDVHGYPSEMPDYFEGINSIDEDIQPVILKVVELKRELVNARKENIPEPPRF